MSPSKTFRKIDIEGPMPHTRPIPLSSYNVYDVLIHAGFMGGVCACVCFRPCLFLYNFRVYFWPCLFSVSIIVKNRRVRVYFRVRVYLSCLFVFFHVYFQKIHASCLFVGVYFSKVSQISLKTAPEIDAEIDAAPACLFFKIIANTNRKNTYK